MEKCERCLNGRSILSENGWSRHCSLSYKKYSECQRGKKDHCVEVKREMRVLIDRDELKSAFSSMVISGEEVIFDLDDVLRIIDSQAVFTMKEDDE